MRVQQYVDQSSQRDFVSIASQFTELNLHVQKKFIEELGQNIVQTMNRIESTQPLFNDIISEQPPQSSQTGSRYGSKPKASTPLATTANVGAKSLEKKKNLKRFKRLLIQGKINAVNVTYTMP